MNGQGVVIRLVGRLQERAGRGVDTPQECTGEGILIDPFTYHIKLAALKRNAVYIITAAIAQTPERYENVVRRELADSVASNGQGRRYAIDFFTMYIAPVLAQCSDTLEEEREHIINTILRNARANSFYRGMVVTIEATARQVRRNRGWSIEERVTNFVTQERWEQRYVPIIRKYME